MLSVELFLDASSSKERLFNSYSLEVSIQLLLAAARPVEAMKRGLHKGGHDAPQADFIPTSVSLAIVLHA